MTNQGKVAQMFLYSSNITPVGSASSPLITKPKDYAMANEQSHQQLQNTDDKNSQTVSNGTKPEGKSNVAHLRDLLGYSTLLIGAVSIAGFITVTRYLEAQTSIISYDIAPQQYLAAGWGILMVPIGIILVVYIATTLYWVWRENRKLTRESQSSKHTFRATLGKVFRISINDVEAWIIFVVWIAVVVFFYTPFIYPNLPRSLGGGKPEHVILIFNDTNDPTLWNLPIDSTGHRTKPLLLLAEYSNGVLVKDDATGVISKVNNDVLIGSIDAEHTPTPTATAIGTSTLTVTPKPTN